MGNAVPGLPLSEPEKDGRTSGSEVNQVGATGWE
jgi:hypothetical protein